MATLVLDPYAYEVDALKERRRISELDPPEHAIHWLGLAGGEYRPLERSCVIDLGPAELAERIDWP